MICKCWEEDERGRQKNPRHVTPTPHAAAPKELSTSPSTSHAKYHQVPPPLPSRAATRTLDWLAPTAKPSPSLPRRADSYQSSTTAIAPVTQLIRSRTRVVPPSADRKQHIAFSDYASPCWKLPPLRIPHIILLTPDQRCPPARPTNERTNGRLLRCTPRRDYPRPTTPRELRSETYAHREGWLAAPLLPRSAASQPRLP